MTTTTPEPPDGTIVGWGQPVEAMRIRIDHYARGSDRHWYGDADADIDPATWAELLDEVGDADIYRFVPVPLTAGETP